MSDISGVSATSYKKNVGTTNMVLKASDKANTAVGRHSMCTRPSLACTCDSRCIYLQKQMGKSQAVVNISPLVLFPQRITS